ncbi:MAG: hypothetical protein GTO51_05770 [Candidatus Latescibacteria bacterium]|nr:hypothetical protein [Candidatus Latescibacterota bacterium]NIM65485.1 hypothetical protein [Candidatus Latescibacterota bacterium]NIO01863.1 hypothetical protein [Candidatus Latescibacterota bacterium]NIO28600.1 hypothetical protein [Candidatus Latescibacterota bacterium]NIO56224.1 hypothetical protein [Candidatus Latescibacterota bacterium]
MASFDVHVIYDDQEGISDVRVVLSFTSVLRGMTAEEYTDSSGHAWFDGYEEGEIEVFIDGASYGTYHYSDGGSITITK